MAGVLKSPSGLHVWREKTGFLKKNLFMPHQGEKPPPDGLPF